MKKKMFLKLEGIRGESQNPRYPGAIEISAFMWGNKHPQVAGAGTGKASISDLTITRRSDTTSSILWVACHTGQSFAQGFLTTEDLSEQGSLIRSGVIEMKAIVLESMSVVGVEETITLNFEKFKILRS
jgi:type VI protein secretion system component Hcp